MPITKVREESSRKRKQGTGHRTLRTVKGDPRRGAVHGTQRGAVWILKCDLGLSSPTRLLLVFRQFNLRNDYLGSLVGILIHTWLSCSCAHEILLPGQTKMFSLTNPKNLR